MLWQVVHRGAPLELAGSVESKEELPVPMTVHQIALLER